MSGFSANEWGIYDSSGNVAIDVDSFVSLEFKTPSKIANYIQEDGAFASYNKVQMPYDARIVLAVGGDDTNRSAFLAKLEEMKYNIDLYSIVSPDATYVNGNLENYNYKRTSSNGVTMITAELWFKEIRVISGVSDYQPSQPSGADSQNGGTIQGQTDTTLPEGSAYA